MRDLVFSCDLHLAKTFGFDLCKSSDFGENDPVVYDIVIITFALVISVFINFAVKKILLQSLKKMFIEE